ncbi:hypothetical protein AN958_11641 [Leucoagaricus sp. SymC.cos]|nr:hypothetical protein AN958_11641 [Leucoagaricus sp. SymC.cos]
MTTLLFSAHNVVEAAQTDDVVIFLWSFIDTDREEFLRRLGISIHMFSPIDVYEPYHFRDRKWRSGYLLVTAPSPQQVGMTAIRNSFQLIHTQLKSKGIGFVIHIWVHDVSCSRDLLGDNGMPQDWGEMKDIFEGMVGMDQVTFLLTGWEKVKLEQGLEEEWKIHSALMKDIEKGLAFERLFVEDRTAVWMVLEDIIDLTRVRLDGNRDIPKRIARSYLPDDDEIRFFLVQKDIDTLRATLDKSPEGWKLHMEIRDYLTSHKARIDPLLAQIDDEHEIGRKKKEAETTVDYEYLLFRKTMWSFFEAIEKLEISIGPHLQAFYGFNAKPPPKKSFFRRFF